MKYGFISYNTLKYEEEWEKPPPPRHKPNVMWYAVNSVLTFLVFYNINGRVWDIKILI
jgi:hypothetical protein